MGSIISVLLFIDTNTIIFIHIKDDKKNVNDINEKRQLAIDLGKIALLIEQKDSLVANYLFLNNQSYIEEYTFISEQLNEILDRVEPYYQTGENKDVFD